jgi:hypothetical protein
MYVKKVVGLLLTLILILPLNVLAEKPENPGKSNEAKERVEVQKEEKVSQTEVECELSVIDEAAWVTFMEGLDSFKCMPKQDEKVFEMYKWKTNVNYLDVTTDEFLTDSWKVFFNFTPDPEGLYEITFMRRVLWTEGVPMVFNKTLSFKDDEESFDLFKPNWVDEDPERTDGKNVNVLYSPGLGKNSIMKKTEEDVIE